MNKDKILGILCVVSAVSVWAIPQALATPTETGTDVVALCNAALRGNLSTSDRDWARRCVRVLNEGKRVITPTPPPSTGSPIPSPTMTSSPDPSPIPSPTPTSSPTPGGCPDFPAFPDASCTGYLHTGVSLRDCGVDPHLETPNQTYDSCLFRGTVRIQATGIKILRSKVIGVIAPHWSMNSSYGGLLIQDTEITSGETNQNPGSIAPINDGSNYTAIRLHVHHASTGIGASGNNVKVIDSYVHDMTYTEGAHQAALGIAAGRNIEITHNNLDCRRWNVPPGPQGCSSALSIYDEGTLDGVTVRNNLLNSAGEYCTYTGGPAGRNVKYFDNRFGKKYHPECGRSGPVHSWYPNNVGYEWRGNAWADGSGPVNP